MRALILLLVAACGGTPPGDRAVHPPELAHVVAEQAVLPDEDPPAEPQTACVGVVPQATRPAAAICCYPDKEGILRIIRARHDEVRGCYERALARDPEVAGSVQTRFVIGSAGDVPHACSTGDGADEILLSCVARVLTTLQFPGQGPDSVCPELTTVSYPFTFRRP